MCEWRDGGAVECSGVESLVDESAVSDAGGLWFDAA